MRRIASCRSLSLLITRGSPAHMKTNAPAEPPAASMFRSRGCRDFFEIYERGFHVQGECLRGTAMAYMFDEKRPKRLPRLEQKWTASRGADDFA